MLERSVGEVTRNGSKQTQLEAHNRIFTFKGLCTRISGVRHPVCSPSPLPHAHVFHRLSQAADGIKETSPLISLISQTAARAADRGKGDVG